jgi:MFS family permease
MARTRNLQNDALRFVVVIGICSFFADCTYEGSRGVIGPYLATLQASGAVVGIVTGLGELLGYVLRFFTGAASDLTGRYWTIILFGYALQMASVPALALTHSWPAAAAFIILERIGKGIRNPPRDALVARAGKQMSGYGWAFGLHQALDQAGAMAGPLLVAAVVAVRGSYRLAFAVLAVPAVITIGLNIVASRLYPTPREVERSPVPFTLTELPGVFWLYLSGAALVAAGFADYPLIAYHFARVGTVPGDLIAVLYAIAMAAGGAASLILGRLFDRYGFAVLVAVTLVSALFAPLVFFGSFWFALTGAAIWGIGMAVHESVIPAAVAPMVSPRRRASAFGLFTAVYGVFWFLGSVVIGLLYDVSIWLVVAFCLVMQLMAIPLLAIVGHRQRLWVHDR